ncbi:exodeoxyribonuclease VII small subunit [Actinomycetaceae bacterium TAE3-ERU4]|nr:exodeoxyribonuclease VII small subunit [Actinomycetaceae bacterium TAE3-ERU4]
MTPETEINSLSYEAARSELIETTRMLESRDVPLEEALKLWEHGQNLARHCEGILLAAKKRIEETEGEEVN